jgi:hypothetical protein
MEYKSFLPPICFQSAISDTWYIIANGIWNKVDRQYSWKELESMWIRETKYSKPKEEKKIIQPTETYKVPGSRNNEYTVVNNSGIWTCSCPAHGFGRGKDCKHILLLRNK